ncbi:MAG: hypothetical protein K9K21_05045 [Desulfotignum sp.]|nr:hypothetical protein [Desulfotignum sp.]MCF8113203.1 hypothetical protein [Desulfotignum sp.]MCF8125449.1 hypothetical protein [Desulfotignum sp.]
MDNKTKKQRQEAFDSLPQHIKEKLTPEEKQLFLFSEEWPDTLFEKMDEFLIKNRE